MTKLTAAEFHNLIRQHIWYDFNEIPLVPEQELPINNPVVWPRPFGLLKKRLEFELYATPKACLCDRVCEQDLDLPEIVREMGVPGGVYHRTNVGNSCADEHYIRVGDGVLYVRVGPEEDEDGEVILPDAPPNRDATPTAPVLPNVSSMSNLELVASLHELRSEIVTRLQRLEPCSLRHLAFIIRVAGDDHVASVVQVTHSTDGDLFDDEGNRIKYDRCDMAGLAVLLSKVATLPKELDEHLAVEKGFEELEWMFCDKPVTRDPSYLPGIPDFKEWKVIGLVQAPDGAWLQALLQHTVSGLTTGSDKALRSYAEMLELVAHMKKHLTAARETKAEVTYRGLLSMQVCVPVSWTDDQVVSFANLHNPAGTSGGWRIRKPGPGTLADYEERVGCESRKGFVHIMLDC